MRTFLTSSPGSRRVWLAAASLAVLVAACANAPEPRPSEPASPLAVEDAEAAVPAAPPSPSDPLGQVADRLIAALGGRTAVDLRVLPFVADLPGQGLTPVAGGERLAKELRKLLQDRGPKGFRPKLEKAYEASYPDLSPRADEPLIEGDLAEAEWVVVAGVIRSGSARGKGELAVLVGTSPGDPNPRSIEEVPVTLEQGDLDPLQMVVEAGLSAHLAGFLESSGSGAYKVLLREASRSGTGSLDVKDRVLRASGKRFRLELPPGARLDEVQRHLLVRAGGLQLSPSVEILPRAGYIVAVDIPLLDPPPLLRRLASWEEAALTVADATTERLTPAPAGAQRIVDLVFHGAHAGTDIESAFAAAARTRLGQRELATAASKVERKTIADAFMQPGLGQSFSSLLMRGPGQPDAFLFLDLGGDATQLNIEVQLFDGLKPESPRAVGVFTCPLEAPPEPHRLRLVLHEDVLAAGTSMVRITAAGLEPRDHVIARETGAVELDSAPEMTTVLVEGDAGGPPFQETHSVPRGSGTVAVSGVGGSALHLLKKRGDLAALLAKREHNAADIAALRRAYRELRDLARNSDDRAGSWEAWLNADFSAAESRIAARERAEQSVSEATENIEALIKAGLMQPAIERCRSLLVEFAAEGGFPDLAERVNAMRDGIPAEIPLEPIPAVVERIASLLGELLAAQPGLRMAILPPEESNGQVSEAGRYLADMLRAATAKQPGAAGRVGIVSHDGRASPADDAGLRAEIASKADATHLLLGHIYRLDEEANVFLALQAPDEAMPSGSYMARLRVADLPKWAETAAPDDARAAAQFRVEWSVFARELSKGEEGRTFTLSRNSRLRSGDGFKVRFRLDRDAYVYVLNFDTQGTAQCIFPNPDPAFGLDMSNWVLGGQAMEIPAARDWFFLDNKTGTETVVLVVSAEPIPVLQALIRQMAAREGQAQLIADASRLLDARLRGIARTARTRGVGGTTEGAGQGRPGGGRPGLEGAGDDEWFDARFQAPGVGDEQEILEGRGIIVRRVRFGHE